MGDERFGGAAGDDPATSALEEQQGMMLRVMSEMVKLGKAIEGSGRARCAEGKVAKEVGAVWWVGPMWPKCAFGDQKGLIQKKRHAIWQSP